MEFDGKRCTLNKDDKLLTQYKEALKSYINGIEFRTSIDDILNALSVKISDCYIIGNLIYYEKQESEYQINPNLEPDWFKNQPRYGNLVIVFSDDVSLEKYYELRILYKNSEFCLYEGEKGKEGYEILIEKFRIDYNIKNAPICKITAGHRYR